MVYEIPSNNGNYYCTRDNMKVVLLSKLKVTNFLNSVADETPVTCQRDLSNTMLLRQLLCRQNPPKFRKKPATA